MMPLRTLLTLSALFFLISSPLHADTRAGSNAPPSAGIAETGMDGIALRGIVLETMNSAGYTYLLLDTVQGQIWVAIPEDTVHKGEAVIASPGMTMRHFESKTLGRSFDAVIFSPGLDREDMPQSTIPPPAVVDGEQRQSISFAEALQAERSGGMPVSALPANDDALMGDSPGSTGAIVPSANVEIEKASGDNSFSVGECFEQAAALDNTTVRVRGKVVKISRMIMGKNWLHIQDGTGNPLHNHHDLVVTTLEDPGEDVIVTVEGVLKAERDFGAGYRYEAIIEDARIEK